MIRDIPSYKKMRQDLRSFRQLRRVFRLVRPFLRLFRIDTAKLDEAFAGMQELEPQVTTLMDIPDRFNDLFASRGWIMYGGMSDDVALTAIAKGEAGDLDGAEQDLVCYYSNDIVALKLTGMKSVKAFGVRYNLALKALTDYKEERYHACIPVTLALIDGLVNEVHAQRRGFFAEETSLEAWDSVAAHDKGLNSLARLFRKSRQKTVTDEITIPYRNGIMHGMDLGYDNRIVAAKCWGALFAVKEWAHLVETGQHIAPAQEAEPTLSDLWYSLKGLAQTKQLLDQWRPRALEIGVDLSFHGEPEVFALGSPERKLAEYLGYWGHENYGCMSKCIPNDLHLPPNAIPRFVRGRLSEYKLRAFDFVAIGDVAPSITKITTNLMIERAGRQVAQEMIFHMVLQDGSGKWTVSGSDWVVYNWNLVP